MKRIGSNTLIDSSKAEACSRRPQLSPAAVLHHGHGSTLHLSPATMLRRIFQCRFRAAHAN